MVLTRAIRRVPLLPLQHFWWGHAQTRVAIPKISQKTVITGSDGQRGSEWVRASGPFNSPRRPTNNVQENAISLLKSGGREGIRTLGLLVANEEKSKLRCGTTIT